MGVKETVAATLPRKAMNAGLKCSIVCTISEDSECNNCKAGKYT